MFVCLGRTLRSYPFVNGLSRPNGFAHLCISTQNSEVGAGAFFALITVRYSKMTAYFWTKTKTSITVVDKYI